MTTANRTSEELLAENEELRLRLEEAEETLRAIGSGEVDAFVVSGPDGEQQVFTLKGADYSYRVLVETMNEGAATLTPAGDILYCNNRLATMLHAPLEKLIGTRLISHVAPADQTLFTSRLGACTLECDKEAISLIASDGTSLPVLFACCAMELSEGPGIGVVITDMRAQKEAEAQLREAELQVRMVQEREEAGAAIRQSETRLSLALEGGQMGLWEWDVQKDVSVWNSMEYQLLGLPVGDGIEATHRFFDQVHPDDAATLNKVLADVMENGSNFYHESRILRADDGQERWLAAAGRLFRDDNGQPVKMVGVNYDITARKQSEENAKRQMEELNRLNEELASFNNVAVGRELRMIELKKVINEMCINAGLPQRYDVDFGEE